jgi:N-methylhydantoinase A/oxoprolinase/acetone carboxylase beta subunit
MAKESSKKPRSRSRRQVKIGIDVGGTFTHAVALEASTLKLLGTAVVPTTHAAKEGVARGVVEVMQELIRSSKVRPADVSLIAHSTTQATNALLEGDVARVGIIGLGRAGDGWVARRQTKVGRIELAPEKFLETLHRYCDVTDGVRPEPILRAAEELRSEGAEVFVVSEAFGVDDRSREHAAAAALQERGLLVTAASDISQLYGLRVRTRTAVINASMLPKMLEAANMTEQSVRKAGITTPLMIMRSDGGIMDIQEMRRRPILTMLSGPAAGVAAALMYARVSDGLFLEVGGTSTDISIIKNGRPMVRTSEVGGHRLFVKTLDIRTVGIGGGSMVRWKDGEVVDVGPRSAHIAGLHYPSFSDPKQLADVKLQSLQPRPGDPGDYAVLVSGDGRKASLAVTTTDALNLTGTPSGYARGDADSVKRLAEILRPFVRQEPALWAGTVLTIAARKVTRVVEQFVREYELDRELLSLVGGGGGAEAVVPESARQSGLPHTITAHAEVISAIGAALGMIRDTVERSIISPTEADILRIRADAAASVAAMGASADSIDVRVEVDTKQKRLIAVATGVPELRTRDLARHRLSDDEITRLAGLSMGQGIAPVEAVGATEFLRVFRGVHRSTRLFGWVTTERYPVRVVGTDGVVRLKLSNAIVEPANVQSLTSRVNALVESSTVYGDAGGLTPDVFVLISNRIVDLCGVATKDQILTLVRAESDGHPGSEPAVIVVAAK